MLKKVIFIVSTIILIIPLTTWAQYDDGNNIAVNWESNNIIPSFPYDMNQPDPNLDLTTSLTNTGNTNIYAIRRRELFKETADITTSIGFNINVTGDKWESRYTQFEVPQDLTSTENEYFNIRIKGYGHVEGTKGFIKVQLLDADTNENSPIGTYPVAVELPMDEFDVKSIPLYEFEKSGANLSRIKRVVIHYGEEVWQVDLNTGGSANIKIDQGWFSKTPAGEEPPKPKKEDNDDYFCFIKTINPN